MTSTKHQMASMSCATLEFQARATLSVFKLYSCPKNVAKTVLAKVFTVKPQHYTSTPVVICIDSWRCCISCQHVACCVNCISAGGSVTGCTWILLPSVVPSGDGRPPAGCCSCSSGAEGGSDVPELDRLVLAVADEMVPITFGAYVGDTLSMTWHRDTHAA